MVYKVRRPFQFLYDFYVEIEPRCITAELLLQVWTFESLG